MAEEAKAVGWGILGTADIARKLVRAISRAGGSRLVAVGSRTLERVESWCEQNQIPSEVARYGNYEEVLRDGKVDVVYIPLPTSMHKEWVQKAADAGKHILCEKPVGMNAQEVEEMIACCEHNNVQFMDGVMWMHHVRVPVLRKAVDNQDMMGEVVRIVTSFTFFGGEEFDRTNIRMKSNLDGLGCVGDLGWYNVRAIVWAFQKEPNEDYQVYAVAHKRNSEGVIKSLNATLFYDDGRFASLDCGFDTNCRQTLEIAGTKSSIRLDDFVLNASEESSSFIVNTSAFKDSGMIVEQTSSKHEAGGCCQEVRMVECMSKIVRTRQLEDYWPKIALQTQRTIDAIMKSAESGQPVKLK
ncbi:hypothetical protein GUITHDRAFT_106240 [Guillardia theta CCMP2712]|uniref:Gfo/Idh/MocA-like oxidoreductase N-terminal domain-containing protein n=1 Tax=Guillardia theta (strain CCMP2712) TaxID=905079 RepID=L1JJ98_GUITC|nr:hypothetical protein GUITHDRAFT_106240 [Guillardia theta CCMP2712]EKX48165.1 hypothetical protein GUITHDRAFT_106240 [Guillardia theta CCMP2712]|eukprot:XP_005835145.1 hypothetical protein GUITHDRAFT_106240 [Guillardia theta CCMP2712]